MKVQAYYQNWQIFWGAGTNPGCRPLTPASWQPIAKNLDRISYGFALLGEHDYVTKTTSGFAEDVPQNYAAHMMYDGTVFTWMAKDGTDDQTVFKEIMDLKKENPDMKSLLAFGGWTFTEGTTATYFTTMMNDPDLRGKFMDSAVALAQPKDGSYKFDGIEIDWEYPGSPARSGTPNDFYNMEQFAIEFKKKYPNVLLSFDCGPFLSGDVAKTDALPGYPANDPVPMNGDDDYYAWLARLVAAGVTDLQVMAYDFFTPTPGGITMPNAPLFPVNGGSTPTSVKASDDTPLPTYGVTVYGTSQTLVKNLLTTYNNVDAHGNPDYASFAAVNNLKPVPDDTTSLVPGQSYKVCGVQYTVQSGDSFYKICTNPQLNWIDTNNCTPSIAEVSNYNKISNPANIQPGQSISLPVPLKSTYSGNCARKPAPSPSGSDNSISKTITGLVKAFKAKGVDPSKTIWCGLAQYGHSYAGVDLANAQNPASFGQTTKGAAPGGFFTGNCGKENCGSLSYREIEALLKGPSPACTPVPDSGEPCGDTVLWDQIPNQTIDKTTATAVAYDKDKGYWITYDNPTSMCMKMCWLSKQEIAGVMLFGPGDDTQDFELTNAIINYAQKTPVSCEMPDSSTYTCPNSSENVADIDVEDTRMCL